MKQNLIIQHNHCVHSELLEFNKMKRFCSVATAPALCAAALHKIKSVSFDAARQMWVTTQREGTSKKNLFQNKFKKDLV